MSAVVSLCVGRAKDASWRGQTVRTGIWKSPVASARARRLGFEGDEQADLTVHGGPDKAVYGYAAEHYGWWRERLPGRDLPYGVFGENLTLSGFDDAGACLGDRFRAGGALLESIQPRLPCLKLGVRFDDPGMIKVFLDSGRLGVYFRVIEEGEVKVGDRFEKVSAHPDPLRVYDLARLYVDPALTPAKAARALEHPMLNDNWREMLSKKLRKA